MKIKNYLKGIGMAALVAMVMLILKDRLNAAQDTDKNIESAFKDSRVYHTYLSDKGDSVKIQSKNGMVTLSGTVSNDADKSLAEATALDISGVKNVDNKLDVSGARASGNSDGWIEAKVKTNLLLHKNVSGTQTNVDVKNGIVTLTGEAQSQAQKDLTTKYAENIEGVKDVKNELRVAQSPKKEDSTMSQKVDDASITAQVKTALLFHRSTSAMRTQVTTKNGTVTLSGQAKSDTERALVTQVVSDVDGVKDVVNNMSIQPDSRG